MRTTIRLKDRLLVELKRYAVDRGTSMTAVIEDALRELFARRQRVAKAKTVKLPTYNGRGGLMPGVDLDNNAALLDIMDGRYGTPRR